MDVRKFTRIIMAVSIVFGVLLFLIPILLSLWAFLWIVDLPNMIGKRLDLDQRYRSVLYTFINEEELTLIRDDFINTLHSRIEYQDNLSKWGLRREIDRHRERAIRDLKQGEQVIAVTGGIFAVLIGNLFGFSFGGLVLTIVVLFYSLIASFRVLVVDSLAFSGQLYPNASMRELSKMKTWNEGPLRGSSGVAVVLTCLFNLRGRFGYQIGLEMMDDIFKIKINYDDEKWKSDLEQE